MKLIRFSAAILIFLIIFSSMVSCTNRDTTSQITVASSNAAKYAEWLNERLDGNITDNVVVGIGDDESYAVDMSSFEEDGYLIKHIGETTVIFGKTEDGLDRGVRKYANSIEFGEDLKDFTYHEGERIEKLLLFGTDISEFTVVCPEDANDNMRFGADELIRLIEKATGTTLPITVNGDGAEHRIILRHIDDPSLKNDGYHYFEENGDLIIEGAVARGISNGVYGFLQNELGWQCLIFGDSYLEEADLIDVPVGLVKSETPIFDYLNVWCNDWNKYITDRTEVAWNSKEMSYGPYHHAFHGFYTHKWTGESIDQFTDQICFSSDSNIETAYDNILAYIKKHTDAGGTVGVTLKDIDVSQGDNIRYCICSGCSEIMGYDKSTVGPVLYFANSIAEMLEEDGYEELAVHIFAYFSTKKPPEVTIPHKNVHITFAQNGNCSNHSMYGRECTLSTTFDDYYVSNSNADNDLWLSKWCEISDNVVVWYYALDTVLQQYTILDVMLEDFRYMDEKGIRALFWQITHHGFGVKRVEQQLGVQINWNRDMTDEEYEEELCRILEREYGPGWQYIREYLDLMIEATDRIGCYNCWIAKNFDSCYDEAFVRETYKTMIELVEKAIRLAGSTDEEYRCKLLSCSVYYTTVFSHYFLAYENNDQGTLTEMNELYNILYNRIIELGFTPEKIITIDGGWATVHPTLEEEAWTVWRNTRERVTGKDTDELRTPPEWVLESDLSVTAEPGVQ